MGRSASALLDSYKENRSKRQEKIEGRKKRRILRVNKFIRTKLCAIKNLICYSEPVKKIVTQKFALRLPKTLSTFSPSADSRRMPKNKFCR
jgi:hypothetical protein